MTTSTIPRLRILPTVPETVAEYSAQGYFIVIDRAGDSFLSAVDLEQLRAADLGARGVIVFSDEVDLDGAEVRDRTIEASTPAAMREAL